MNRTQFDKTVVIVDDDEKVLRSVRAVVRDVARIVTFSDPHEALRFVEENPVALIVADQRMPEMTGTELLVAVMEVRSETTRFLLTGYSDLEAMVEAINVGHVHRYIEKPWHAETLKRDVSAGIEAHCRAVKRMERLERIGRRNLQLENENQNLKRLLSQVAGEEEIVTGSAKMGAVLQKLERCATGTAPLLIRGETGTGKELVALRFHRMRHGMDAPFVAVNCGALPEGLVESELFGHEKGAFTGADRSFPGAFERASGGTIFLDEVAELKPSLQVKLLRVLEGGSVRRVGGRTEVPISVSVVAATHKDLGAMLGTGEFRQDLYYRLNVVDLELPPLRERTEDIPLLVNHFLSEFRRTYGRPGLRLTSGGVRYLSRLDFPGNVRELRNIVERAVVSTTKDRIGAKELASARGGTADEAEQRVRELILASIGDLTDQAEGESVEEMGLDQLKKARELALEEVERYFLESWFRRYRGNVSEISRRVGLSRTHIYRMLRRLDLPDLLTSD
jgi:DNA-binding NtrC family response regulator